MAAAAKVPAGRDWPQAPGRRGATNTVTLKTQHELQVFRKIKNNRMRKLRDAAFRHHQQVRIMILLCYMAGLRDAAPGHHQGHLLRIREAPVAREAERAPSRKVNLRLNLQVRAWTTKAAGKEARVFLRQVLRTAREVILEALHRTARIGRPH